MPVPAGDAAHLVLVQPHLLFGVLEGALDAPARAGHPHHGVQVGVAGSMDSVGGSVVEVRAGAPEQQGVRLRGFVGGRAGDEVRAYPLDVWVRETETGESVPHNEAGIEALCERLTALAPDCIVVETTGGRKVPLAAALQAVGLPVAVVNPRQARAVLVRHRQIAAMGAQEKTRLARASSDLQPRIRIHLEWLQGHAAWQARAELPELGHLNGREIAALVGVAPLNRDSGQYRGPCRVWGGRASVRTMLYMTTVTATRHNLAIRAFYTRLCRSGKPRKVALAAAMRKLLLIFNAVVRDQVPWQSYRFPNL